MDSSRFTKLLCGLLAVTAGSTDAVGFLGLGGLFTAHITGNLVILAARIVAHGDAPLAVVLSVPVFMVVLVLSRLLAAGVEALDIPSLPAFLVLQLLLLAGFLGFGVAAGPRVDPQSVVAILAGMFGVAAMAVQNALVQIALKGNPPTAVMTTNVTRFALDLGELLVARDAARRQEARSGTSQTWPQIVGFLIGCAIGAALQASFGSWSAALPVALAALAAAMSFNPTRTAAS